MFLSFELKDMCGTSSLYTNTSVNVHNTLYMVDTYLHRLGEFQNARPTGRSLETQACLGISEEPGWETTQDLLTWGPEMVHTKDNDGTRWTESRPPRTRPPFGNQKSVMPSLLQTSVCERKRGYRYKPVGPGTALGCKGEPVCCTGVTPCPQWPALVTKN